MAGVNKSRIHRNDILSLQYAKCMHTKIMLRRKWPHHMTEFVM